MIAAEPPPSALWVAAWAASSVPAPLLTAYAPGSDDLDGRVVRQDIPVALGGTAVRLRLTHAHGRAPAAIARVRVAGTPLRFGGRPGIVLRAGAVVRSDPLRMPVRAGEPLRIELRVARGPLTGALAARATTTVDGRPVPAWLGLAAIEVAASLDDAAVAVVGDSIAAGPWPALLALRRRAAVVAATDGAALLTDGPCLGGDSGLRRLARDTGHAGIESVVLALGTNDLVGGPAQGLCPARRAAGAPQLVSGLRTAAARLRSRGLRAIGTTIPPRGLAGTAERTRRAVNAWLRATRAFDAVADVDAVLRDPADTRRLDPAAEGDGLHPGPEGHRRIAAVVRAALIR